MSEAKGESSLIQEEIIKQFQISGELKSIKPLPTGNIHKTYVATYEEDRKESRYLVQQINNYVFKNPYEVMDNIEGITTHIQNELKRQNDNKHKVLNVIETIDNRNMLVCKNEEGIEEFYRVYNFIENTISHNTTKDHKIIETAGKAFGNFQKLLNNYPIETLKETIVDFHHTKNRLKAFEKDIKEDCTKRVKSVENEIKFILDRKDICSIIVDKLDNKEIPYRVTHNDTKVNNVMFDSSSNDFIAVVDLDTVMPGSRLYDYGDGIRSASANVFEDEKDLNKVYMINELFESYTDGYLSELAPYMNNEEINLMGQSIRIITLELAMRFLNDYINGDKYFKCNYETHNLDRARNQLKLVEDIESKMEYINSYINKSYKMYR